MVRPSVYTQEMVEEYTSKGYWGSELIWKFCERNAQTHPGKEALVDSHRRLTWDQVKQETDSLALSLRALGFQRGDVLLVQLPNCAEHFLVLMACEKAGIVVVRAPITFRQAELQGILKHTETKGALTPYEFRGHSHWDLITEIQLSLPQLQHILVWGETRPPGTIGLKEMLETGPKNLPLSSWEGTSLGPLDVGQINATSGTTGIPKCCELTGNSRVCTGKVMVKRLQLTGEDIFACLAPFTAGGTSTIANHAAPQVTAKVVMLESFSPAEACQLIEKERVTGLGVVPTLLNRLVNFPDLPKYDLSSLRFVLSATALLPYSLAQEAEAKLNCIVVNMYGALDFGSVTTTSVDDPLEVRYSTVGRPIDGTESAFWMRKTGRFSLGRWGGMGKGSFLHRWVFPQSRLESANPPGRVV